MQHLLDKWGDQILRSQPIDVQLWTALARADAIVQEDNTRVQSLALQLEQAMRALNAQTQEMSKLHATVIELTKKNNVLLGQINRPNRN